AEALAREIAAFPQVCMRHDRLSAYEQHDLPLHEALAREFAHGLESLASPELGAGLKRFRGGAGRHGKFE
ncbi:MAG: crotonase/enoyl-CoA hydratase family protein, partial [Candidatus Binatia bacterium]